MIFRLGKSPGGIYYRSPGVEAGNLPGTKIFHVTLGGIKKEKKKPDATVSVATVLLPTN